jgi:hypothetical protein
MVTRAGEGRKQLPVAIDVAIPVQSASKTGPKEFAGVEINVGVSDPAEQGSGAARVLSNMTEQPAFAGNHAEIVGGQGSKIGDGGVRTGVYEAANVILTQPVKGSALKSWGMRLAAMRKAKVALARKLAVVLHRMLTDGTNFLADKAAAAAAAR